MKWTNGKDYIIAHPSIRTSLTTLQKSMKILSDVLIYKH